MLKFQCQACQSPIGIKEEHAGKRIKCPKCGEPTHVPALQAAGANGRGSQDGHEGRVTTTPPPAPTVGKQINRARLAQMNGHAGGDDGQRAVAVDVPTAHPVSANEPKHDGSQLLNFDHEPAEDLAAAVESSGARRRDERRAKPRYQVLRAGGWAFYGLAGLCALLMLIATVVGVASIGQEDAAMALPMVAGAVLYMAVAGVVFCVAGAAIHAFRDIAINSWK
jgi:hypothetical protein